VSADATVVDACCCAMRKTNVVVAFGNHLAVEFFVGHCDGFHVDDGLVELGDFICGALAIGRCRIQDEATAGAMPFFCLVLLLLVLLFHVVELLVLGGVLGFGGFTGSSHRGTELAKNIYRVVGVCW
jgi:hypothetical protein